MVYQHSACILDEIRIMVILLIILFWSHCNYYSVTQPGDQCRDQPGDPAQGPSPGTSSGTPARGPAREPAQGLQLGDSDWTRDHGREPVWGPAWGPSMGTSQGTPAYQVQNSDHLLMCPHDFPDIAGTKLPNHKTRLGST